jgi:hypothetical protein
MYCAYTRLQWEDSQQEIKILMYYTTEYDEVLPLYMRSNECDGTYTPGDTTWSHGRVQREMGCDVYYYLLRRSMS